MKKDYRKLVEQILEYIGGETNIIDCFHCLTRLRIVVKNIDIVNIGDLKELPGIIKVNVVGSQVQCVIGPNVVSVYEAFCEIINMDEKSNEKSDTKNITSEEKKVNLKSIFGNVLEAISSCVQPILPVIICGGMLKFIATLFGPAMLGICELDSDFITLITMVGDAAFYFLPVMIGYTGSKYFGCSLSTGLLVGGILLHPTLITLIEAGNDFTVYGIPMTLNNYANSIIPMILITYVMTYVEKFFNRITPNMLKLLLVPLFTVLVMLPIGLCILGPLGLIVGNFISETLVLITNSTGIFGIALAAAVWVPLVMTGMHLPVATLAIISFTEIGYDKGILCGVGVAMFAIMGMCLGFMIKTKSIDGKAVGLSCLISQALGGVSEPAIYGIGIKYRKPFLSMILGGFAGGVFMGIFNVQMNSMALSNVLGILQFSAGTTNNFIFGTVGCIFTVIITTIFTYTIGFNENE